MNQISGCMPGCGFDGGAGCSRHPGRGRSAGCGPLFPHWRRRPFISSARRTENRLPARYRTGKGKYDEKALGAICRVFGAPSAPLRLIEFLDFLEDRLNPGARIVIISGYRTPQYNAGIRNRGALAAKASLHQYDMAADLRMEGIPARRIWDYVKALGFGGAGYYHGDTVHVDVGPARSWDETTSGVGTGISDDNKLIGLVTDYDVYLPGESRDHAFYPDDRFSHRCRTYAHLESSGRSGFPRRRSRSLSLPLRSLQAARAPGFPTSIRWPASAGACRRTFQRDAIRSVPPSAATHGRTCRQASQALSSKSLSREN